MKVYEITPCKNCSPYVDPTIKATIEGLKSWLDEAPVGDVITIRVLQMTSDEYRALPEYEGP